VEALSIFPLATFRWYVLAMADDYHHGSLRQAVLDRAVAVIAAEGPEGFSLRSLAADLGVSHTAPRHHFGSREGVLNAVAAQGFRLLAERLAEVRESGSGFLEAGVAYVDFALSHPAHFRVMFSPSLLDETNPELHDARQATFAELRSGVDQLSRAGQIEDAAAAVIAAWAIVHGIATLALTGNLDAAELRPLIADGDILAITRRSAGMLYGSPTAGGTTSP
jgi:AcrR family transcriptional regulator